MSNTTSSITDTNTLQAITAEAERILTGPERRQTAVSYLGQRGINGGALPDDWPLGYAPPGWTNLTNILRASGFDDQELLDAGLARRSSRDTLIDVFRDRVIFPIHDRSGAVAGFVGRDLSGAPGTPKYLNTAETPLFNKGALLYGLHEAEIATPRAIRPVLVEGPLDVLALATCAQMSGDADLMPLATCGTAVTPAQARLIAGAAEKYDLPVVIAMDGDTAGRSAAVAAGEQLRRTGRDVLVAILPNGMDPTEWTADPDRSLNVFRQSDSLPLLTVQIERCIAAHGEHMQWVEGRVAAARGIARILSDYPPEHAIAQTGWISSTLDIAPSTFAAALSTAYREAHALPPAGTRAGALLRAAADPRRVSGATRSNLTEETPTPACSPTLTQ
jgi:DNA primase